MEEEILKEPQFTDEIVSIIRSGLSDEEIIEKLHDYHDNDIARSLEALTKEERIHLYNILDPEWVSEIFTFIEEPEDYIEEIGIDKLAAVINEMDSDDAVDLLEEIDESEEHKQIMQDLLQCECFGQLVKWFNSGMTIDLVEHIWHRW